MIASLMALSVRMRWAVVLFFLAIAGIGLWQLARLPIDAVPDITNKQVQINTVNPGPIELGHTDASLPFSASFAGDLLVVHANAGWLRDKATHSQQGTWGLGPEINLNPRRTLVAESFGSDSGNAWWQTGARYDRNPGLFGDPSQLGRTFSDL